MFDLQHKVAVITGAAQGIGAETAKLMASLGAAVALLDRNEQGAQKAADSIISAGGRALACGTDVADNSQVDAAFAQTAETFGQIDITVANAGIQLHDVDLPTADADELVWDQTHAVNLTGAFLTCRAGLRHIRHHGGGGAIVIVSSVTALGGMSRNHAYTASKTGMLGLGRSIATAYAKEGIRCNIVCPGALETTPDHDRHPDPEARQQRLAEKIPMGRLGKHKEMAPIIAFLASDAASYATGAIFTIDGGLTIA